VRVVERRRRMLDAGSSRCVVVVLCVCGARESRARAGAVCFSARPVRVNVCGVGEEGVNQRVHVCVCVLPAVLSRVACRACVVDCLRAQALPLWCRRKIAGGGCLVSRRKLRKTKKERDGGPTLGPSGSQASTSVCSLFQRADVRAIQSFLRVSLTGVGIGRDMVCKLSGRWSRPQTLVARPLSAAFSPKILSLALNFSDFAGGPGWRDKSLDHL